MRGFSAAAWAALAVMMAARPDISMAQATEPPPSDETQDVEEVIVTGTRRADRTVFESTAPIDAVTAGTLRSTVSDQIMDKLVATTPSFNVLRQPTADGQQFNRSATLRGLSPDHTLVLVNSKRRHRSAFLGARGAQSADLASLPAAALERIEVLRDGASAQYGSDAIAGVINLILSDDLGLTATAQASQYFEGDGRLIETSVRYGLPLGERGRLVGTLEFADGEATSRTRQRPDAIAFQAANPTIAVANPVQRWGQPDREVFRAALNLTLPLGTVEFYGFATYADSTGVNDFNWRNPATDTSFRNSPAFPGYNLRQRYPAGFTPRFGQDETDYQVNGGVRGALAGFAFDLSASTGEDEIDYSINETINASLGPQSPTNFRPGVLSQEEDMVNLDTSRPLAFSWLAEPASLAGGLEYRNETYVIQAGDPASYTVGPGAAAGLPSSSNGFPGYGPTQAGSFEQDSYAGYLDLELPLTDAFTVDLALRYEDFSVFGDTTDYKLAGRYAFTPDFAVRATASTGFRAPTPAQLFSSRTSQGLDTTTLQLFTAGRLSPLDPISVFFGAQPLRPEESENLTLGAVFRRGGFNASIDLYRIEVQDRLASSASFRVTPAIRTQLLAAGVPGADVLTTLSFFQNAFDTETRGVDLVATYRTPAAGGRLELTAAYNFNDTEVTRFTTAQISQLGRVNLEDSLPQHTANLSADYSRGSFGLFARLRYFGEWTDAQFQDSANLIQTFGDELFVDLAASYALADRVTVTIGAENLFDEFPDEATFQASRGLVYSRNAVYDTDGGRYYVRLGLAL